MFVLKNPTWFEKFSFNFDSFEKIPAEVFDTINRDLDAIQGPNPEVSIVIPAWNEEINILRTIASLSKTTYSSSIEILVVNNNSTDRTQDTINKLHVKGLVENIPGAGAARQLGQEQAKGKYILLADADCFYPSCWVEDMMKVLKKPGVVCVYGRYSFIGEKQFPRWKLFLLEKMKDFIAEFRHIYRPYFNAYGISMGYVRDLGLKVGFILSTFRGEDGQLCLGLMEYGKIKQVRSNRARAWTGIRTLKRDGNLTQIFLLRFKKEVKRFLKNFDSKVPERLS